MLMDMASLDIAGKNDLRLAVEHFVSVGVPQGPVIVVFGDQARDGAGGIRLMSLAARRTGVQQADIQHSAYCRRVGRRKVFQHGCRGKALAMDRHAPLFQEKGLRPLVVEHVDILRKRQCPRHLVGRVVISGDGDHGDAGLAEADHLRHEIQARPMVFPVAVVEVAGNQDEGHRLVDGQLHEVFQGPAAGLADLVDRGAFVALQAPQGAIQVDVGGVKEFEHALFS